ncbi:ankyrin repeat domain-containing protein [uncultured Shewanella sp.]|uniref:ankyrin repeat domain-containing protein n=1 Tax=uncultured Shewanella sp. TaxID=173975 RepID=UPI00263896B0|nr:ankyrin repeat domain-containing protein [uncultured Shewanella sp.]
MLINKMWVISLVLFIGLLTASEGEGGAMFSKDQFSKDQVSKIDKKMQAQVFFEPEMAEVLIALQQGKQAQAQMLMSDHNLDLNVHGKDDITPLLWLIMVANNKPAAKLALDLGADPNFKRANGDNAVTMLAGGKDVAWLELILAAGGNANAIDRNGQPALFSAIGAESWDNIHALLDHGADVNLKDRSGRNSALYPAYIMKYEFSYFFIEQEADPFEFTTGGANLAWNIHKKLTKGIIKSDSRQYPWVMKIKQHLINQGVEFPPLSPKEVRAKWAVEGKPE